jgi:hypothetical protein
MLLPPAHITPAPGSTSLYRLADYLRRSGSHFEPTRRLGWTAAAQIDYSA